MKKIIIFLLLCGIFSTGACLNVFASNETVIVVSYAGDIKVVPFGESKSIVCKPGMILNEGTRLITGEESYIKIAFGRAKTNIMKVNADSEVVIKLEGEEKAVLVDGVLVTLLKDVKRGTTFRIRTPCAIVGARGTGWIVETNDMMSKVLVFDDGVFIRGVNEDGSVMEGEDWIEEGFRREINRFDRPGKMIKVPEEEVLKLREEFGLVKNDKGLESFGKGEMIDSINAKIQGKIEERTEDIREEGHEERFDELQNNDAEEGGRNE
ncbi:MAG: hypothetical protein KAI70_04090 [Candidatus Omnitrophica bacterium]|nr:hypothetical protein [Candidatus Omnitrophota bacterium]